jgi:hypothetical protein
MKNQFQESLQKVQSSLLQMHRYLIGSLKSDREHELGHAISPVEWLQTMISLPTYAWLKPLTGLMSDFDALMDNYEVTENELKIVRQELENLFLIPTENPEDFNWKYSQVVRKDSDVMLYHGQLRQMILTLPKNDDLADSKATRLTWHQKPRHRT